MATRQVRTQQPVRRPPATAAPAATGAPSWIAGPEWETKRWRQTGWLLAPLRGFLGLTFLYAGLQKLANPTYLDPHNRASVVGQMQSLQHTSPIGPLLGLSLHAPTLVGLLIAFGELAVGVGVLLGLWTRLAAVGGMALALTFFLTVSWNTTPYYFGSDIVFLFAWTVIAAFGTAGVLSLDALIRQRARAMSGLGAEPVVVGVDVRHLRRLCGRGESCALQPSGACGRMSGCPVFPTTETLRPQLRETIDRRAVLLGARAVGVVAVFAGVTGGMTALIGRAVGGTKGARATGVTRTPRRAASPSATPDAAASAPAPGTAIGPTTAVPVGQGARFNDPATGAPAWVVQPSSGKFLAFSAVCTHAGCTVDFDSGAMQFVCPCHGGTFDATSGQVLGGPPPSPLQAIPVHVVGGQIRVD